MLPSQSFQQVSALSQDTQHHSESQQDCSALLSMARPQLRSVTLGNLIKTSSQKKITISRITHSADSQRQNRDDGTSAQSFG